MTTCLLASPECHGPLQPLPVLSDEELRERFPNGARWNGKRYESLATWTPIAHPLDAIKCDPRRWVRCGECEGKGKVSPFSLCPTCNATGFAHVCERHRADLVEPIVLKSEGALGGKSVQVHPPKIRELLSADNRAFAAEFGGRE